MIDENDVPAGSEQEEFVEPTPNETVIDPPVVGAADPFNNGPAEQAVIEEIEDNTYIEPTPVDVPIVAAQEQDQELTTQTPADYQEASENIYNEAPVIRSGDGDTIQEPQVDQGHAAQDFVETTGYVEEAPVEAVFEETPVQEQVAPGQIDLNPITEATEAEANLTPEFTQAAVEQSPAANVTEAEAPADKPTPAEAVASVVKTTTPVKASDGRRKPRTGWSSAIRDLALEPIGTRIELPEAKTKNPSIVAVNVSRRIFGQAKAVKVHAENGKVFLTKLKDPIAE